MRPTASSRGSNRYSSTIYREVSEYLVGSPAFKAGVTGDPRQAGSIPVHLRQLPKQFCSQNEPA